MDHEEKNEIGYTIVKDGLGEAGKRFKNNPLVYAIITLGLFAVVIPIISWFLPSNETIPLSDLETLKNDLENVREAYKRVHTVVEKVVSEESYRWHLSNQDREWLEKLSKGKKSVWSDVFKLFYFLLNGTFFFLLGIWIERRWLWGRHKAMPISFPKEDVSLVAKELAPAREMEKAIAPQAEVSPLLSQEETSPRTVPQKEEMGPGPSISPQDREIEFTESQEGKTSEES